MPQMSPLMWLSLYAFFTVTFLSVVMMIFFLSSPAKTSTNLNPIPTTSLNWKW
uniref:ATP synthase F0 subunit 8 n=1 Tax=Periclimenes brevicarpalis TaxID=390963 RepID=UPI001FA73E04|nr:ATP synthase F0 subunit 8 [Periclimenes brevicarpalis]UMY76327.1 ATP synthase F0 subunit 8 [Periclimenes brevicarpalis]